GRGGVPALRSSARPGGVVEGVPDPRLGRADVRSRARRHHAAGGEGRPECPEPVQHANHPESHEPERPEGDYRERRGADDRDGRGDLPPPDWRGDHDGWRAPDAAHGRSASAGNPSWWRERQGHRGLTDARPQTGSGKGFSAAPDGRAWICARWSTKTSASPRRLSRRSSWPRLRAPTSGRWRRTSSGWPVPTSRTRNTSASEANSRRPWRT